jgi:molybdopterin converting factor small subunit
LARVRVRLMGTLRRAIGREEFELSVEPPEVAQVIHRLSEMLGQGGAQFDPENPGAEALILLNGVEISNLEGLRTQVEDGDMMVILPVAHGG